VAYFALGGLAFTVLPSLRDEFLKYPGVYRSQEGIKVDFQDSRVTSDGGLILVRELDERLGFGKLIE
jgi:hypothetical protein